ncbi:MAG: ATPase, partial [Clostridia bacterium]|nr:ATPase [Clostridia bacterium]
MDQKAIRQAIAAGQTSIGIELGSTRIKSVLTGPDLMPVASGSFDWENSQVDGIWTYRLDDVWHGMQSSFAALAADVKSRYDLDLTTTGAIGISGMMHGYLAFDHKDQLLVPFRTWRNTITGPAS